MMDQKKLNKAQRHLNLEQLAQARPDLHEKVKAKSMNLRDAMIEAGLRKPTVVVPTNDLNAAAAKLSENFELSELIPLLQQHDA
ncbi:MAG: hypothetical protein R2880_12285 [Deinococcales bacterium]